MIPGAGRDSFHVSPTTGGPGEETDPLAGANHQQTHEGPDRFHHHSGRTGHDDEEVPMTSTQATSAAPIDVAAALDVLRRVAQQLADITGLPFPTMIRRDADGLVVHVHRTHLPQWVIVLDLPAPDWDVVTSEDGERLIRSAKWPDHVFAGAGFRLACQDSIPVIDAPGSPR